MIKKSCNLIGQEHILVNHSVVSAVHDKKTLFPLEFKCSQTTPRPIKFTLHKSGHVWTWLGMHGHAQTAIGVLYAIFPCLLTLFKTFKTMVLFFQKYWWSKNQYVKRCVLIGQEHILVCNLTLSELNWWKNVLYLEMN